MTTVTDKTNIKENQTLNQMLFSVEKVKMSELTGFPANSDYEYAILGEINGEKKLLNSCSERYELIPNANIFPNIRETLFNAGLEFSENYKMVNDARFYGDFTIESEHTHIGSNNDIVKPMVRVRHSYNGKTNYAITFGYFRLVCSNGLVLPVKGKEAQNIHIIGRHTSNINHSLELLNQRLENFVMNQGLYKEIFDQMAQNEVLNPQDRVKELLEFCKIPEKKTDQVMEIVNFESQKLYNGQINDWLLYNSVNQIIHKGENKKVLEQKESYDYKAIEFLTA